MPTGEAVRRLDLTTIDHQQCPEEGQKKQARGHEINPMAALIPWLTSMSTNSSSGEAADAKPSQFLVAKGLPTLLKLVEKN